MVYWTVTENVIENINKRIKGLMTRHVCLLTGHVETVCLDEIKKKMGDKNFRGVVCLALAFLAVLVIR